MPGRPFFQAEEALGLLLALLKKLSIGMLANCSKQLTLFGRGARQRQTVLMGEFCKYMSEL